MKKRCLIICGGEYFENDFSSKISRECFDYIIACDKGYEYCLKLNIKPDIIIGDFDSVSPSLLEKIRQENHKKYPKEKDDTDTLIASKLALEKEFSDITVLFPLGNRFDHSFANIQTAAFLSKNNVSVTLAGKNEIIFALTNSSIEIEKKENHSLSVFSFSDKSEGVFIKGAEYELENAVLFNTFPIGISNVFKKEKVCIKAENGTLIIMMCSLENDMKQENWENKNCP